MTQIYRQILITSSTAQDQYKHLKKEYNQCIIYRVFLNVYFEQCSSSILNSRSQRASFPVTNIILCKREYRKKNHFVDLVIIARGRYILQRQLLWLVSHRQCINGNEEYRYFSGLAAPQFGSHSQYCKVFRHDTYNKCSQYNLLHSHTQYEPTHGTFHTLSNPLTPEHPCNFVDLP